LLALLQLKLLATHHTSAIMHVPAHGNTDLANGVIL
jgi:hypothetical protein